MATITYDIHPNFFDSNFNPELAFKNQEEPARDNTPPSRIQKIWRGKPRPSLSVPISSTNSGNNSSQDDFDSSRSLQVSLAQAQKKIQELQQECQELQKENVQFADVIEMLTRSSPQPLPSPRLSGSPQPLLSSRFSRCQMATAILVSAAVTASWPFLTALTNPEFLEESGICPQMPTPSSNSCWG